MNKQIESIIKTCVACISVSEREQTEPLTMSVMPGRWEVLHIDMYGPLPSGEHILGIIDACTRWPELHVLTTTTSEAIKQKLDITFSIHGKPLEIVTDNAPNLKSVEMKQFCTVEGIRHRKIGPYWPKANSYIERFYKTLGKALKIFDQEKRNWRNELNNFLFDYRTSPHCTTGISPAELLMGRKLRGRIPHVDKKLTDKTLALAQQRDREQKAKMKKYADNRSKAKHVDINIGDKVLVKQKKINKFSSKYDSNPYEVTRIQGSALTLQRNGKSIMRNVGLVKKLPTGYWTNTHDNGNSSDSSDYDDGNYRNSSGNWIYDTNRQNNTAMGELVDTQSENDAPAPENATPAPTIASQTYSRSNRRVRAPLWQSDYYLNSP